MKLALCKAVKPAMILIHMRRCFDSELPTCVPTTGTSLQPYQSGVNCVSDCVLRNSRRSRHFPYIMESLSCARWQRPRRDHGRSAVSSPIGESLYPRANRQLPWACKDQIGSEEMMTRPMTLRSLPCHVAAYVRRLLVVQK